MDKKNYKLDTKHVIGRVVVEKVDGLIPNNRDI
jgi:hypothetical protein